MNVDWVSGWPGDMIFGSSRFVGKICGEDEEAGCGLLEISFVRLNIDE